MRGRPKKEVTRDIVYKVRLNAEEDQMLTQASEWTGQAKSEVFRKALLGYEEPGLGGSRMADGSHQPAAANKVPLS